MIFATSKETLQNTKAIFTATEIHQQPETWKKTFALIESQKESIQKFIDHVITQEDYDIILSGAGTSEFVGNSLFSYLNTRTNFKTKSYATTDLVATPENYLSKHKPTLLISFGRSGNSPESIGAVNLASDICENVYQLFITCNKEGALSKAVGQDEKYYAINLADETHDKSFAMTSSFTNMYLAALLCFHLEELPTIKDILASVIERENQFLDHGFQAIAKMVEEFEFDRIVYLGSNALKGVAQESALKMLELTAGRVTTMFDTPLGFRHGPKSVVNDQTLTVVFVSDDPYTYSYEVDLIKEMCSNQKKNKVLVIANKVDQEVKSLVDYYYAFDHPQDLNNVWLGLNYVSVAQFIAYTKSISLGLTPDNPFPSGFVNRVVKGVVLYPYQGKKEN